MMRNVELVVLLLAATMMQLPTISAVGGHQSLHQTGQLILPSPEQDNHSGHGGHEREHEEQDDSLDQGHSAHSEGGGHKYDVRHGPRSIHGDGEHAEVSKDARAVAVGLIATVVLVPLVVSMVLSEGTVHVLTMRLLDTFTSIFLAVLWFNTFRQILKTAGVAHWFPYAHEVCCFLQIFVLYSVANVCAWLWRQDELRLTTFCSCGAHFIAFAGVHFAGRMQGGAAKAAGDDLDEVSVIGVCIATAAFLGSMYGVNYLVWRQREENKKLNATIDELEMDVTGLVVSFVITQAVRYLLTGHYPSGHAEITHKVWQRFFMLFWSLALAGLAIFLVPRLSEMARRHKSRLMNNLVHMLKVLLIMLIAWGFLLWGEWEFYENLFSGDPMFGHMLFAVLATMVCLAVLVLVANVNRLSSTPDAKRTQNIATAGVSLVAAWSWEHCFDMAFEIIGDQYQVGYGGLVPKLVLSVIVPAALLPTYVRFVRKEVIEMDRQEQEEEQEAEHRSEVEEGSAPQAAREGQVAGPT